MRSILFVRTFRKPSGGQVKVRDYFAHCLEHPELDPYVFFAADSRRAARRLWAGVPDGRVVREIDISRYEILFVGGRDWELLPPLPPGAVVLNLVQHTKHADPADPRFAFLARPAVRICVSDEVYAAIEPHRSGPAAVISNGVPLSLFRPAPAKEAGSVLIWAAKDPDGGAELHRLLAGRGVNATLLTSYRPREEFARLLSAADVFAAFPHESEGFYLPALEAMASGCAVVCPDAVGNRVFCIDGETCLMPDFGDVRDYARKIERLLSDREEAERIRRNGLDVAQRYSLDRERQLFYRVLEEHVLSRAASRSTA